MLKFAQRPAGPEFAVLGSGSEMQYREPASAADRPITEMYLGVRAWAAWAPGRETEDWHASDEDGQLAHRSNAEFAGITLPALLRRRVSILGQNALRAAWNWEEAAVARFVFASRHGEFQRTLAILDGLARGDAMSPAEFTFSVYHTLAGLLSIARKNRCGHSTISAGRESLLCGLLEAAACLSEEPGKPVVLIYFDEPLPGP